MTAPTDQFHRSEWHKKVEAGVKAAVAQALEEHRKMGRSVVTWRDGQIVTLSPEEIPVRQVEQPESATNCG